MNADVSKPEEASALRLLPAQSNSEWSSEMRRRIAIFSIIVPAVLLLATLFVTTTWSHFSGHGEGLTWKIALALASVAFAPATIFGLYRSSLWLRIVYAVSATWLGILSFSFFTSIACWILYGATWLMGWPIQPAFFAYILFGLALLSGDYGLINAAWIRVTSITIELPNLPKAWRGRSAALLTDLHLGHPSGPRFLRRIISLLRRMHPDAVFISGDMFDGTRTELDRLVAPWRKYFPPRGIYFVTGNHEEIADRAIYLDAVKRTGIHILNNEKVVVDGLQIVGIHDAEARDPHEVRAIFQHARIDRRRSSILLAHQPTNLHVAEEEGISLQLSGHTHRGQFWLWSLIVSRIYGRFAYGLNRSRNLLVYTSSGAGTWGPPFRVGTKSEVVLIRFEHSVSPDIQSKGDGLR